MAVQNTPWRITSQVADQTRNDNAGNTLVGSLIYFTTGGGNDGVVFVPDNMLTVKHIKTVVQAKANLMDEIGALVVGNFGGQ